MKCIFKNRAVKWLKLLIVLIVYYAPSLVYKVFVFSDNHIQLQIYTTGE